jgi:hypothetical protein
MEWIEVLQNREQWQTFVNYMITFGFIKVGIIFRKLVAIDFLEISCTMELGSYLLGSCDFVRLIRFYFYIGLLLSYLLTD